MRIGNIGNISFGKLIEKYEDRISKKQQNIRNMIYDSFDRKSEYSSSGYSIDEYVESKMGADVIITYKSNGNVEMRLNESVNWSGDYASLKPLFAQNRENWVKEEYKKPITLISKQSYNNIKTAIDSYASKCDNGALEREKLEESLMIKLSNAANDDFILWYKKHPNATKNQMHNYLIHYGDNFVYNEQTGEFDK